MSWERIGHPSEMVSVDEEIECVILNIDREKQKIRSGAKAKDVAARGTTSRRITTSGRSTRAKW